MAILATLAPVVGADTAQRASESGQHLFPICVNWLRHDCGLIAPDGHWRVAPQYGAIYENGAYWQVETEAGLIGLLDADGAVMFAPAPFEYVDRFVEGQAAAKNWGYTDENTNGFIDLKGKWTIDPTLWLTQAFSGGLAVSAVSEGDDQRFGYLDVHGAWAIAPTYAGADAFVDGHAVVTLEEPPADGERLHHRILAGINRRGQILLTARKLASLEALQGGNWLAWTDTGYELLDSTARRLFQITGEDAQIKAPSEGLAFFSDGQRYGLLDAASGKPIVPLRADWLSVNPFSEGVAWVQMAAAPDEPDYALIDRKGRSVFPQRFAYASDFHFGVASVKDSAGRYGLIDKTGKAIREPAYAAISDAWEASAQTPVASQILKAELVDPVDQERRTTQFLDTRGRVRATVEPAGCGDVEVVKNGTGEVIWPQLSMAAVCAEHNHRDDADEAIGGTLSADRLALRLYLGKRRLQWLHDIGIRDHGRAFPFSLKPDPATNDRREAIDHAEWIRGPATIELDDSARLELPQGYKYLSASQVISLAHELDYLRKDGHASALKNDRYSILAPEDELWIARVFTEQSGYVVLDAKTTDSKWLNDGSKRSDSSASTSWILPPEFLPDHRQLYWINSSFELGSLRGDTLPTSKVSAGSVTWGRHSSVSLIGDVPGVFTSEIAFAVGDEVKRLGQAISFVPGSRYTDYADGDPQSPLRTVDFISGRSRDPSIGSVAVDTPRGAEATTSSSGHHHGTTWVLWPILLGIFALISVLAAKGREQR